MKQTILCLLMVAAVSCAPAPMETEQVAEPEAPTTDAALVESYPDPDAEVALEVQEFVSGWVGERSGEDGVYAIPPRAGHEVTGVLTDFHTVHQKDADTYSVCVDFRSDEVVYDVDFFVDRTTDGLAVAEHFLHKIDGEAIE